MTVDRWNPKRVTIATPKFLRLVMTSTQQGTVEPMGKTWGMRVRGDVDKLAPQLYRCPVHGEFVREVPMSRVPDVLPCDLESWSPPGSDKEYATREDAEAVCLEAGYQPGQARLETHRCAADSPWAGSPCGIGHAAGECES